MSEVTCKECGGNNVKVFIVALPINEAFGSSMDFKIGKVMNVDAITCFSCGAIRLHLKAALPTN